MIHPGFHKLVTSSLSLPHLCVYSFKKTTRGPKQMSRGASLGTYTADLWPGTVPACVWVRVWPQERSCPLPPPCALFILFVMNLTSFVKRVEICQWKLLQEEGKDCYNDCNGHSQGSGSNADVTNPEINPITRWALVGCKNVNCIKDQFRLLGSKSISPFICIF